jgi:hypothetical protein
MKKLLLSLVMLGGCFGVGDANNYHPRTIYQIQRHTYVYDFLLKDKTRCVLAMQLDESVAITCNWQNK